MNHDSYMTHTHFMQMRGWEIGEKEKQNGSCPVKKKMQIWRRECGKEQADVGDLLATRVQGEV